MRGQEVKGWAEGLTTDADATARWTSATGVRTCGQIRKRYGRSLAAGRGRSRAVHHHQAKNRRRQSRHRNGYRPVRESTRSYQRRDDRDTSALPHAGHVKDTYSPSSRGQVSCCLGAERGCRPRRTATVGSRSSFRTCERRARPQGRRSGSTACPPATGPRNDFQLADIVTPPNRGDALCAWTGL
jgi:hypothetical protein